MTVVKQDPARSSSKKRSGRYVLRRPSGSAVGGGVFGATVGGSLAGPLGSVAGLVIGAAVGEYAARQAEAAEQDPD